MVLDYSARIAAVIRERVERCGTIARKELL